jgi:hypothetical protein
MLENTLRSSRRSAGYDEPLRHLEQLLALIKTDTLGVETFELGVIAKFSSFYPRGSLIGGVYRPKVYDSCLDPEQGGFCYI